LYAGDLNVKLFNPVPSTIPKWWTFKLAMRVQRNTLKSFEPIGRIG